MRGPVAGDNDGRFKMSLCYDLIEVFSLSGSEGSETEVIDNQEIWSKESFNPFHITIE